MEYTAVIRTLGMAGEKYQRELDSLCSQTIQPKEIIVYIAEGYDIPKETCGRERYFFVKKGMVAQRALPYDEVKTEYILFLDDDVYLAPNSVERLFNELKENNADVIVPSLFDNHKATVKHKILTFFSGKEIPRFLDSKYGYKVLRTGGFSYNNNPKGSVYLSETNSGPCFLMKKKDFISIKLEEELWLDETFYALPDDQVFFYKIHLLGYKQVTSYDSGIVHLDAGTTLTHSKKKLSQLIFSEYRNKTIFWYRFLFSPHKNPVQKLLNLTAFSYSLLFQYIKYIPSRLTGKSENFQSFQAGVSTGLRYIKEYKKSIRFRR